MRVPMLIGAISVGAAMFAGYLWHTLAALFVTATLVGAGFALFNHLDPEPGRRPEQGRAPRAQLQHALRQLFDFPFRGADDRRLFDRVRGFRHRVPDIRGVHPVPDCGAHVSQRYRTGCATRRPAVEKRSAFDLLRTPQIARVILVSGLIVAAWELYIFYVPVVAHTIGLAPSTIGIILGAFAAATFLIRFAIPVLLKWLRVERMLTVSALVAASCVPGVSIPARSVCLMRRSFVVGLGLAAASRCR
jgi:cyanate permease